MGAPRQLRFLCPPPLLGERSVAAQLCLLTTDFSPPAVSLFSLQSDAEPPWLRAGESPGLMPAPVQTSKKLGILLGRWDRTRGNTGRSLWRGRVCRVGGCHQLGDTWTSGACGIMPKPVLTRDCWGAPSFRASQEGAGSIRMGLSPSEPRVAVPHLQHDQYPSWDSQGQRLGFQRAFGDEMILAQLCARMAGHRTSPRQGHALLLRFHQPVSPCRSKKR